MVDHEVDTAAGTAVVDADVLDRSGTPPTGCWPGSATGSAS